MPLLSRATERPGQSAGLYRGAARNRDAPRMTSRPNRRALWELRGSGARYWKTAMCNTGEHAGSANNVIQAPHEPI
jgi:hypothetical protein